MTKVCANDCLFGENDRDCGGGGMWRVRGGNERDDNRTRAIKQKR